MARVILDAKEIDLSRLPKPKSLSLDDINVSGSLSLPFESLSQLETLTLDGTLVTPAVRRSLSLAGALSTVSLRGPRVTNAMVAGLVGLPKLSKLHIWMTGIDDGESPFSRAPNSFAPSQCAATESRAKI